jgi:hypothetical protein
LDLPEIAAFRGNPGEYHIRQQWLVSAKLRKGIDRAAGTIPQLS